MGVTNRASVIILGGFAVVCLLAGQATAELPPEVIADKHLIEAEQAQEREDYAGAMKIMEKIIALQKEHNFKHVDGFHFKYARIALQADSFKVAFDAVSKYLTTAGREGEFYRDALLLLMEVEKELDGPPKIIAVDKCTLNARTRNCWMELASHPGCYVWAEDWTEEKVKWSATCSGQVPAGRGRLDWFDTYRGEYTRWEEGRFRNGKRHGRWIRGYHGSRSRYWGEYVSGKREGTWFYFSTFGGEENCYTTSYRQGVKVSDQTRVDLSKCKSP